MQKQEEIINLYGMSDPRYQESYGDVTKTFCVRIFQNMMPMFLEVIYKMEKEYNEENGALISYGPVDLFKMVNTVFDNYFSAPNDEVLRAVLGVSFKLVSNFQVEYRTIVEEEDLDLPILCCLTNSCLKFIGATKDFVQTIKKTTKVNQEVIEGYFSYQGIVKAFANISNLSFLKIQNYIEDDLTKDFMNIQDHKSWNMEKFIEDWFQRLYKIMNMIISAYTKKLWKYIFEQFCLLYVQMIIAKSQKYGIKDKSILADKIATENELSLNVFKDFISNKEFEIGKSQLEAIHKVFIADKDELMTYISTLRLNLRETFNLNCIKLILRLRPDLSKENKEATIAFIIGVKKTLKASDRITLGKMLNKALYTEVRVREFLDKLRKNIAEKKELLAKTDQKNRESELMQVLPSERIQVEMDSLTLTGEIDFYCTNMPKGAETHKYFMNNKSKFNYTKKYFFFTDDILNWKEKVTDKPISSRCYLIAIKDMDFYETQTPIEKYFYFKVGLEILVMKFTNELIFKKWSKAIHYLVHEAFLEYTPIVFPKFNAVSLNRRYEELFQNDKIDYNYDKIKVTSKTNRERRRFDFDHMDVENDPETKAILASMIERSDGQLTDDELDEEDGDEDAGEGEAADGKKTKKNMKTKMTALAKNIANHQKTKSFLRGFKILLGI